MPKKLSHARPIAAREGDLPTSSPASRRARSALRRLQATLPGQVQEPHTDLEATHQTLRKEIRRRVLAEGKLEQSRRSMIAFMNCLPGLAWVKALDGRYLYVSTAFLVSRMGALGKRDDEIAPSSESASLYRENDHAVVTTKQVHRSVEPWLIRGEQRRVLVTRYPILDALGRLRRLGGIGIDVTDLLSTEVRLDQSEERFRQLAESITEVFWMTNLERNRVLYISPTYERIWGRSRESLVARPDSWMDALHPDDRDRVVEAANTRQVKGQYDVEYRILRPDGSVRWIRDRAFPIRDASGRVYRLTGIAEDMTERKESEQALEESHRRLQALSSQILTAQENERRHIARELHDEIGQSLTALKLRLQAIQKRGARDGEIEECMRIADQGLTKVHSLSLDLRPSQLEHLGLPAALRWHVHHQAQSSGLRSRFSCGRLRRLPDDLEIACFRIAQEALTNVVRHARASHVWVDLRRSGPDLRLTVRDDGCGFDATSRDRSDGSQGLGLLGMRERVELVGGRLELLSSRAAGTEVRATFPLNPDRGEPGPGR